MSSEANSNSAKPSLAYEQILALVQKDLQHTLSVFPEPAAFIVTIAWEEPLNDALPVGLLVVRQNDSRPVSFAATCLRQLGKMASQVSQLIERQAKAILGMETKIREQEERIRQLTSKDDNGQREG